MALRRTGRQGVVSCLLSTYSEDERLADVPRNGFRGIQGERMRVMPPYHPHPPSFLPGFHFGSGALKRERDFSPTVSLAHARVVSISTRQLFIVDECSSPLSTLLIVTSTREEGPMLNVTTKGSGAEEGDESSDTYNTSLMSDSAFSLFI